MKVVSYSIDKGLLKVHELSSGGIVKKYSYDAPVLQIFAVPKMDGCLVLLDPSSSKIPTFENLLMVDDQGEIKWKAQLPTPHDAFVSLLGQGEIVKAQTWNGIIVELDLSTGAIRHSQFTK